MCRKRRFRLSLENRRAQRCEDPGAEMVDQLTVLWERYGRIVPRACSRPSWRSPASSYYHAPQNETQKNAASEKLAEANVLFWQGDYDRSQDRGQGGRRLVRLHRQRASTPTASRATTPTGGATSRPRSTEYKAYLAREAQGMVADAVRRSLAYALESDKQYAEAAKLYDGAGRRVRPRVERPSSSPPRRAAWRRQQQGRGAPSGSSGCRWTSSARRATRAARGSSWPSCGAPPSN